MDARIDWIEDRAALDGLRDEWDRLAAEDPTPFVRHAWFSAWWDAFVPGGRLQVCIARRDGELVAVFPLYSPSRGRLRAMANDHTSVFSPLARDGEALSAVCEAALARAGELEVTALAADGDAARCLRELGGRQGRMTLAERHADAPIVVTTGDVEAYRKEKKSNLRETERRRRKLVREHEVDFRLVEPPADLEAELQRGFEVEASGWKGETGTAILGSPATRDFYLAIGRAYHDAGELALSGLTVDGKLVAFDFALLHGGRYWLQKTGYDESFRKMAPGLVLRLAVVERCFEMGLEAHEFIGDDMDYKRLFATDYRRHEVLRSYSRRPVSAVRYSYRRSARPALRRVRERLSEARGRPGR